MMKTSTERSTLETRPTTSKKIFTTKKITTFFTLTTLTPTTTLTTLTPTTTLTTTTLATTTSAVKSTTSLTTTTSNTSFDEKTYLIELTEKDLVLSIILLMLILNVYGFCIYILYNIILQNKKPLYDEVATDALDLAADVDIESTTFTLTENVNEQF